MSEDVPSPAFWSGLGEIADSIENEIAAILTAPEVDAKERRAPDVFVET